MSRWINRGLALLVLLGSGAVQAAPGRTDGPEGSEYGAGGYWRYGSGGQVFAEAFLGAATVDTEDEDVGLDSEETDLLTGIDVGYMVEDWLAFQVGYGRIRDQDIDLFSVGMRSMYDMDPFVYYFSLGANLYSPDNGGDKFAVTPGVGAQMILSDRLRVGLGYQHDFVFSDASIDIDRFSVRLRLGF